MKNLSFVILLLAGIHVTARDGRLPLFKVGIIADVQYCDAENKGTRHYRLSVSKLRDAVSRFRKDSVEFIINLGDFIDRDFKSFEPVIKIVNSGNIPVYHVLGNHDFEVDEDKKEEVPDKLGLDRRYYSFTRYNWRFIFLDGNDISVYRSPRGSKEYEMAQLMLDSLMKVNACNAYGWNGAIGKRQAGWIKQQLDQAGKAGENAIVLCHFPIFPPDGKENLWNYTEIKGLITQFSGKLVFFSGHTHRSDFNLNDNSYYVSFRGMVEEKENSFAIAEIFSDTIIIKGFGKERNNKIK